MEASALLAADWGALVPSAAALLDILVLAAIIYFFLNLIQGTRAFPMLLAAALLLALFYGTRWAGLETTRWLVTNLFPYFLFALIVIYAGEIRRGLARLGRGLPFGLAAPERGETYDDIVLASSYFSQHRIGGLVVLEREVSLGTYIESGIALDALLSYDLLVSIFRPESPLHDGAVIARKSRVVAAGCFLPLSLNPLLSAQLGTRHRAAIGVTEESDAIAVVVSEQTGAISVMSGGSVELNLTPDQLRERLRRLLHPRGPRLWMSGRAS